MTMLRLNISMSLDGYVAGPKQSVTHPLGEGGEELHKWLVAVRTFRAWDGSVWTFLDLTPFGRQETWEDSPAGWPQTPPYEWWRRHDEY